MLTPWILLRFLFVWLVGWLVGFLTFPSTTRLYRGRAPRQRLAILRAATHETELGDHDFCLSRSHYIDTDPTIRERAATAAIEPGTSSPGVALSCDCYCLGLIVFLRFLCAVKPGSSHVHLEAIFASLYHLS